MRSNPARSSSLAVLLAIAATLQVRAATTPEPSAEPSPSASPVQEQVLVPAQTIVIVKTRHSVNSYGEETGAKLTYEVVQDVVVNGYLVAKAGDVAEGVIQNAQEGRNDLFNQKAANLRVSVDTVYNFCGDKIDTDFVRSEFRQRQGLFGSHKDVEIIKGQMYQVPTERPQKVCAERTTEKPLRVPSGALLGDKN
jgi:hypothetical protein